MRRPDVDARPAAAAGLRLAARRPPLCWGRAAQGCWCSLRASGAAARGCKTTGDMGTKHIFAIDKKHNMLLLTQTQLLDTSVQSIIEPTTCRSAEYGCATAKGGPRVVKGETTVRWHAACQTAAVNPAAGCSLLGSEGRASSRSKSCRSASNLGRGPRVRCGPSVQLQTGCPGQQLLTLERVYRHCVQPERTRNTDSRFF